MKVNNTYPLAGSSTFPTGIVSKAMSEKADGDET